MDICIKILYFFGALLSFADPFTDGLTCWKYFEAGKILWFSLCIVFMVLPSIVYFVFWIFILPTSETTSSGKMASKLRCCVAAMCCPLIPCCGKLYVALSTKKHEDHDLYIEVFNCLEVGIELAPQFILQFYAAMVQEKAVGTIQIVSLSVTFLRIGWCYAHINEDCKCRVCLGGLLSVAARVFAFGLFAVALGPWVVLVIVLHMAITCIIQRSHKVRAFGYVVLSWLSYTPLGKDKERETDEENVKWTSRTFIQPLMHVVEDIFMAVMYYLFVASGGRTYPHRLKIMFGLIGATLLGYIALRLSRFGKCQSQQSAELNEESCEENLNEEEAVVVVVVDGKKVDQPVIDDANTDNQKVFSKAWVRSKLPRSRDKQTDLTKSGREGDDLDKEEAVIGIKPDVGQSSTNVDKNKQKVDQPRPRRAWFARFKSKETGGNEDREDLNRKEPVVVSEPSSTQPITAANDVTPDPPRFSKAWVASRLKLK